METSPGENSTLSAILKDENTMIWLSPRLGTAGELCCYNGTLLESVSGPCSRFVAKLRTLSW